MARIRSVHPDLHRDRTLASVSASAERTFVRLWCHLDDEGRGEDDPDLLKSDLYPRHRDMDAEAIEADLVELARRGLVVRYEVRSVRYLACKAETWVKYQKPQKKKASDLPGYDDADSTITPLPDEYTTPTVPLPPGGEGRGEGVGGERNPPGGNGEPFEKRLANELRNDHGWDYHPTGPLHDSFQALLTEALERLPQDRHHGTTMGVIARFVELVQGFAMTPESRSHTGRLVRNHTPSAVLHGYGQALDWGAGTTADYASDPLALSKYVAGVLNGKSKRGAA